MYAWIWRHLPGSLPVKIFAAAVLAAAVVTVLMLVVFPAVESALPFTDVTL